MSGVSPCEAPVTSLAESPYRRTLKITVGTLAYNAGFATADDCALETLTEMLHSCKLHCCTVHFMDPEKVSNKLPPTHSELSCTHCRTGC